MCCGGAADRVGTRFARNGARHDEDARGRTETRARSGRSISPPSLVRSLARALVVPRARTERTECRHGRRHRRNMLLTQKKSTRVI